GSLLRLPWRGGGRGSLGPGQRRAWRGLCGLPRPGVAQRHDTVEDQTGGDRVDRIAEELALPLELQALAQGGIHRHRFDAAAGENLEGGGGERRLESGLLEVGALAADE